MYVSYWCTLCQKSKIFTILKSFNKKYTRDPLVFVLLLSLATCKEHILSFSFCHNLGWGLSLKHFFQALTTYIFFCLKYPLVLVVISEKTPGVLSEKYNFDRGHPSWNLKINIKHERKLILLWFWAIIFSL